eukprot:TRINITY_DN3572_c0_g1_i11.p1 TRINITY_DN3572_c0_g1~~TRINITY_DN3572_c0_g1_i11.p1  ORF type:complete len:235 (-),score=23.59 TRINITY_DN3572_c0_g1_i11:95-799(-)
MSRGSRNVSALQFCPNSAKEPSRKLPFELRPSQPTCAPTLPPLSEKTAQRVPLQPLNGRPKVVHLKRTNYPSSVHDKENRPMVFSIIPTDVYLKEKKGMVREDLSEGTPKFRCESEVKSVISRQEIAKRNFSKGTTKNSRLINEGDGSISTRANAKWQPKVIVKFRSRKNMCIRVMAPKDANSVNNDVSQTIAKEIIEGGQEPLKAQQSSNTKDILIIKNADVDSFNLTFGGCK